MLMSTRIDFLSPMRLDLLPAGPSINIYHIFRYYGYKPQIRLVRDYINLLLDGFLQVKVKTADGDALNPTSR